MTTTTHPILCRGCHQPLRYIEQPRLLGNGVLHLVTCWNRGCGLWAVTLELDTYGDFDLSPYLVENPHRPAVAS